MAIRIKSHWPSGGGGRSLPEIASALAFIAWRIAMDQAINLHRERFVYGDDAQRLGVIREYLVFLIQIADRLAYAPLEEADRRTLITGLALKAIEHVQDNSTDLLGPGDYGSPFIELLNRRADEYADFQWDPAGPSYALLRHLGTQVQALMGADQENRWVIDQVMEQDGPAAYRSFTQAFRDLFASAGGG